MRKCGQDLSWFMTQYMVINVQVSCSRNIRVRQVTTKYFKNLLSLGDCHHPHHLYSHVYLHSYPYVFSHTVYTHTLSWMVCDLPFL